MASDYSSPIVCFLDESATDDRVSDRAVLGGIVMNRKDLPEFDNAWGVMLSAYGVVEGLHMKEFGPGGKNEHIVGADRGQLFSDAVAIIKSTNIFSFGASLSNRLHEQSFSQAVRASVLSAYAAAFMMCVTVVGESGRKRGYDGNTDYSLDSGNNFRRHVEAMAVALTTEPELAQYGVGRVHFEDDVQVPELQAADLVAWATRRRSSSSHFRGPLSSLERLFDETYVESPLPDGPRLTLAASVARREAGLDPA